MPPNGRPDAPPTGAAPPHVAGRMASTAARRPTAVDAWPARVAGRPRGASARGVGMVRRVVRPDRAALVRGAAVTVAISLPMAVIGGLVDDDEGEPSALVPVFFLGVLLGFAAGGFVAGRSARSYPYTTGALAAVAGFAVVQVAAAIVRIAAGDGLPLASVAFYAFVSYGCGLTGAVAASRRAVP